MSTPTTTTTTPKSTSNCNDDANRGGRTTQWFAIMAFSVIALAALVTNFEDGTDIGDQTGEVKWVVSAISIAMSFATISVLAHVFIPDKFPNTNLETGMVRSYEVVGFVFFILLRILFRSSSLHLCTHKW